MPTHRTAHADRLRPADNTSIGIEMLLMMTGQEEEEEEEEGEGKILARGGERTSSSPENRRGMSVRFLIN